MIEDIFLIILVVLGIVGVIVAIYSLCVDASFNKKDLFNKEKRKYTLICRLSTFEIDIIKDNDINRRYHYTREEYLKFFNKKDQLLFIRFLNDEIDDIIIYSLNLKAYLRFNKDGIKNNTFYASFLIISDEAYLRITSREKILLVNSNILEKIIIKENKESYYLIAVNFNLYDLIKDRYDSEVLKDYLNELWFILKDIIKEKFLYAYFESDMFLIYFNSNNIIKLRYFLNRLRKNLKQTCEFNYYKFELRPTIGFIPNKKDDIDTVINKAIFAATKGKNVINTLDTYLGFEYYQHNKKKTEFDNIIKSFESKITLNPLYNLNSGLINGYFPSLNLSTSSFKNLDELINYSKKMKLFSLLLDNLTDSILELVNKDNRYIERIFIYANITTFKHLNELSSKINKKNVKIVLLIYDYNELLEKQDEYLELIKRNDKNYFELGIIINNSLINRFSKLLYRFDFLLLPPKFTENILSNNKNYIFVEKVFDITSKLNLNRMANEISDIDTANILKQLSIDNICGSIFDNKNSDITKRQIEKLFEYKE